MEPTNRRTDGNPTECDEALRPVHRDRRRDRGRSSASSLVTGGGDDDKKADNGNSNGTVSTSGGPVDHQRLEPRLDRLGPELRHRARAGEDPLLLRGAVREALHRRQRRRDRRRASPRTRSRSSSTSATRRRTRSRPPRCAARVRTSSPATREGDLPGLHRPLREVLRDLRPQDRPRCSSTAPAVRMDEVAARADAKAIADMKPFAVLNGANQTPAWSDELAANEHHVPRQLLARRARGASSRTTRRTSSAPGPSPEQAGDAHRDARHQPAQGQEGGVTAATR